MLDTKKYIILLDKDKSTDITCSAQNDSPGVVGQFGQAHLV